MRKLLFLALFLFIVGTIFIFLSKKTETQILPSPKPKITLLTFAIVADSHTKNTLLSKALSQSRGKGVEFVIGMGDYTNVGTVAELSAAKKVFDQSGLEYIVTAGDHDLWDSRNRDLQGATDSGALANFRQIFGETDHEIIKKGVQIVVVDNSDIYKGISPESWDFLNTKLKNKKGKLTFVMAHKTPYHPDTSHIMGENDPDVAKQAVQFLALLEKSGVDGFFSGDIHFFAEYKSPNNTVKITTVGAVSDEKNPQGPRFAIVRVFDDYTFEVEDVAIL